MKNNENQLGNLFDKARNQRPETSFDETKGRFLNNLKMGNTGSLSKGIANSINFKTWIIMLSSVSVIIVSTALLLNSEKPIQNEILVSAELPETITEKINTPSTILEEPIIIETVEINEDKIQTVTSTYISDSTDSIVVSKEKVDFKKVEYPTIESKNIVKVKKQDDVFRFPKLTWEQQEQNRKRKKEILKVLSKHKKNDYAFVPSGTYKSSMKGTDRTEKSVQAFYMQTTEVTNLQYRTFLFDLLIQNRKEEFILAKPDQEKWMNYKRFPKVDSQTYNRSMVDLYFSHPAYNNYPVVNISRKGAEMYCIWLSGELKVSGLKTDVNTKVRIPTDIEWKYAATAGGILRPFAWTSPYVRTSKGAYLGNFAPKVKNDSMYWNRIDTTDCGKLEYYYKMKEMDSIVSYMEDGGFHMVKVDSYTKNDFGFYCMSGNVSEMVYYVEENNLPGTKGGSYLSPFNEILIEGKDFFKGHTEPEAEIGFRVVFSHMTDPENSTGSNKIKVDKFTNRQDLEQFVRDAEDQGIIVEYKARYFNNNVRSLKIEMDTDNNQKNCGGIYFRDAFFGGSDEYVVLGWSVSNGSKELILESSE